jgi:hypothetical protein
MTGPAHPGQSLSFGLSGAPLLALDRFHLLKHYLTRERAAVLAVLLLGLELWNLAIGKVGFPTLSVTLSSPS